MPLRHALLTVALALTAIPSNANSNSGASTVSATTSGVDEFNFSQVLGTIANPSQELAVIPGIAKATSVQFLELHLLKGYDANALVFAPKQIENF